MVIQQTPSLEFFFFFRIGFCFYEQLAPRFVSFEFFVLSLLSLGDGVTLGYSILYYTFSVFCILESTIIQLL